MTAADAPAPRFGGSSSTSGSGSTSSSPPSPAQVSAVSWIYLAACAILVSLNLRTLYSSFSAVLPEITAATGLSPAGVTVLSTVPVTLLGLFAPLAPVLARLDR